MRDLMKGHKEECAKYGYSIMCEGWKDKKRELRLIFWLIVPWEQCFVKSVMPLLKARRGTSCSSCFISLWRRLVLRTWYERSHIVPHLIFWLVS